MKIVKVETKTKEIGKPKFYEFRQNNSGGSFHVNENVTHFVFVEAYNGEDANSRAKQHGIYFNSSYDCPCCGPRWESIDDRWDDYYQSIEEVYKRMNDYLRDYGGWMKADEPEAYIYFIDGSKEAIYGTNNS